MGVFEKMPYSNFHNLNLDWMIKKFKAMLEGFNNLTDHVNTFSNRINKNAADIRDVENEQQKLYNRQSSLDTTIGRVERQQAERNATFESGIKSVNTRLTNSIEAQSAINDELRGAIGQSGGGMTVYTATVASHNSFSMPVTVEQYFDEAKTGKTYQIFAETDSASGFFIPVGFATQEGLGFAGLIFDPSNSILYLYIGTTMTKMEG